MDNKATQGASFHLIIYYCSDCGVVIGVEMSEPIHLEHLLGFLTDPWGEAPEERGELRCRQCRRAGVDRTSEVQSMGEEVA